MSDERSEFAAYFTARRDTVRRTAYLLCGDWHFADDLTQLAFVRLAASWHRVRDRIALDAYVHTILIRIFLAENRRWFRRHERSTGDVHDEGPGGDGTTDDVDRRLVLTQAMRRLPPGQRAVLVARYFADLDVSATADALGCSPGTVKSQAARAIRALRGHLSGFDLTTDDEDEVPDEATRPV